MGASVWMEMYVNRRSGNDLPCRALRVSLCRAEEGRKRTVRGAYWGKEDRVWGRSAGSGWFDGLGRLGGFERGCGVDGR